MFIASRFADAKEKYSDAIRCMEAIAEVRLAKLRSSKNFASIPTPILHEMQIHAVLYSNRENCCFELGDYEGAAQDSSRIFLTLILIFRSTFEIASWEKKENLQGSKNSLEVEKQCRLTRALFYPKEEMEIREESATSGDVDDRFFQENISGSVKSFEF